MSTREQVFFARAHCDQYPSGFERMGLAVTSDVQRPFNARPLTEQIARRDGRDAAHKTLYQAKLRGFLGLRAMKWGAQVG